MHIYSYAGYLLSVPRSEEMLLNYFRKKHLLKITTLLPCACARSKIEEEPVKITDHTHSQAVIFDLSRVRALHNLTLRRSEPN